MKPTNLLTTLRSAPWLWSFIALLLLLGYNALFSPHFFAIELRDGKLYGSLIDVLDRAVPVILLSLGMTLVIATGGIDLSVGAVLAIAGALVADLIMVREMAPIPAMVMTLLACLSLGMWNGLLIAVLRVQPIVATLILMVAGRGIAQLIVEGQIINISSPAFEFLGGGYVFTLPFSISIAALVFLGVGLLVRKSAMGLFIEAVGNNELASHYTGIHVRAVKFFSYSLCGLTAGIAGLIVASDIRAADAFTAGKYLELDAILAVVLGGTSLVGGRFSLIGTLFGALIIQTLTNTILGSRLPVEATAVIKALVVLGVCLLQSREFRALFIRTKEFA